MRVRHVRPAHLWPTLTPQNPHPEPNPSLTSLRYSLLQSVYSRASATMSSTDSHSNGFGDDVWDAFLHDGAGDEDEPALRIALEHSRVDTCTTPVQVRCRLSPVAAAPTPAPALPTPRADLRRQLNQRLPSVGLLHLRPLLHAGNSEF